MAKAASVVFADTGSPEALGRVVNALTTVKEFKEAGDDAVVIFDGAGTKWIGELSRADHNYHGLFEDVRANVRRLQLLRQGFRRARPGRGGGRRAAGRVLGAPEHSRAGGGRLHGSDV